MRKAPPKEVFEVAVVGGGVAGATAALTLARTGCRVTLFEASPTVAWRIGETLGAEARPILQSIGIWDEFVHAGHSPCHGIVSAWGADRLVEKDFIFNPYGNAWQLDRVKFESSLLLAAENAGSLVFRGAMVDAVEWRGSRWVISFGRNNAACQMLIDASGRRAMVARSAGVKRVVLDQLVSIYGFAVSKATTDDDSRTFIESAIDGWWYSALMPSGKRTVSFQTDADLLPRQEWRKLGWFREAISKTRHISAMLAEHGYEFDTSPQLTSSHSGCLEFPGGCGWLAVGDAAMSFDPLSGQGILKAMRSGMRAAEALLANSETRVLEHKQIVDSEWRQFMSLRDQYYQMEQRWRNAPFWKRRNSEVIGVGGLPSGAK